MSLFSLIEWFLTLNDLLFKFCEWDLLRIRLNVVTEVKHSVFSSGCWIHFTKMQVTIWSWTEFYNFVIPLYLHVSGALIYLLSWVIVKNEVKMYNWVQMHCFYLMVKGLSGAKVLANICYSFQLISINVLF